MTTTHVMSQQRPWWIFSWICWMWIVSISVPAIIIATTTQTTRSNTSSSCSNSNSNNNNVYYNDYNIIIEGTIPPYFPCIHSQQQQQQQHETHSIECSMTQIQQQQERILTSLLQQLLVSSSLSSFVTNTHRTNTTTHCPPWTILQIQQLDASYQLINAIYLRITLTTTTTTTKNPPDTDVHRQPPPPPQEPQEQQRLWLLSILNAHQATPSNHTPDILQIHMSSTPSTTTTQSIIDNDVQYIPPQPRIDRTTSTEHLLQRRLRRRRTKHQTRRRKTTSTSTTNRHHPNHTLPPPPLRTVGADRAHAMVLPMIHSTTTTIHKSDYASSSPTTTTTATNTTLQNITGVGIRIAILDGGVDYTHIALNGIGTRAAFVQAYGTSIDDVRNTMTHPSDTTTTTTTGSSTNHWNTTLPYFPTDTIIGGYDTLGDVYNNRNDDNHRDTPQNPHHPHNNPFLMDRSSYLQARPDPNPMDLNGHGTAVTHVIRTVAPSAQFIAVKVCSTSVTTSSTPVICPDFAILRGLEYLLDRNHDNVIDTDLVHVINISIGRMYISSYYNLLSKVIESLITTFNIVVVISSGNYGNVPFILGDFAGTPNAITVGATAVSDTNPYNNRNNDDDDDDDETSPATATTRRTMAAYSSRGPAASIQNKIKPDIVAPGGPYSLAYASTGKEYRTFQGTSFSTPFITGGVALLKQKCLSCSPLSIKALLMNHAAHTIHSSVPTTAIATTPTTKSSTLMTTTAETPDEWAPVTLQGSGEMQIHKSLLATYWVYCIEDMNPSISLGLIDAAMSPTIQIHRTLRITKLTNTTDILYLKYELRSLIHVKTISIRFNTPERNFIVLDGCQDEYIVNVTFVIHTSMAPSNHMYSGGAASTNPNNLDHNEIDGWIILSSSQKHENDTETRTRTNGDDDNDENNDVSIPFHMIVRKAANITVGPSPSTTISAPVLNENIFDRLPMNVTVDLQNHGTETAQIDSFQLIYMSTDQPESDFGSNHPPADIRYVGYRTLPVSDDGNYCTTLIEFAIQTWERQQSLTYTHFNIWIDLDYDNMAEHTVYNSAYRLGSTHSEMRRIDLRSNREYCIGYTPDHTTNTANTVLRFCAEDIGINTKNVPTILNVAISSYSFPGDEITDLMDYRNITISQVGLGSPSYDIEAGATLQNISVYGSGRVPQSTLSSSFMNDTATLSTRPMGLLLFTNSFRSWTSTGSATHDSEAIVIVRTDIVPPPEVTPDAITFPALQNTDGPSCCSWAHIIRNTTTTPLQCSINRRLKLRSQTSTSNLTDWLNTITSKGQSRRSRISSTSPSSYHRNDQYRFNRYHHRILQRQDTTCPEYTIPRVSPIPVAQQ